MAIDQRLAEGSLLGGYTIVRLLAKGGMGEVYEAYEALLERKVALKIISNEIAEDEENIRLFITEGKALAQLNHPNVVSIYNLGQDKEIYFIAMEFVEGDSLQARIRNNSLDLRQTLSIFKQLLGGTGALHEKNIIHRDLKPRNIIVDKNNVVKIVDFGIAKIMRGTQPRIDGTEAVIGSPHYMAPEIIEGSAATFQSDVWSLGIILYEMLTGLRPFVGQTRQEVMQKITTDVMKFSLTQKMLIPKRLQEVALKMCSPFLQDRYNSVSEVLEDLIVYETESSIEPTGKTAVTAQTVKVRDISSAGSTGLDGSSPYPTLPRSESVKKKKRSKSSRAYRWKRWAAATVTMALGYFFYPQVIQKLGLLDSRRPASTSTHQPPSNSVESREPHSGEQEAAASAATSSSSSTPSSSTQLAPARPSSAHTAAPAPTTTATPAPEAQPTASRMTKATPARPTQPHTRMPEKLPEKRAERPPEREVEAPSEKLAPPRPAKSQDGLIMRFGRAKGRGPASLNRSPVLNAPTLRWSKIKEADLYQVQVSEDIHFEKNIVDTKVRNNFLTWKGVRPGLYHWRVRALNLQKNKQPPLTSAFSPEASLLVTLPAPQFTKRQLDLPTPKRSPQTKNTPPTEFTLSWLPVPLAEGYTVILARDAQLREKVTTSSIKGTKSTLRAPASGSYFAAVVATNKAHEPISAYSEPARIRFMQSVTLPAPQLLVPSHGTQVPTQGAMLVPIVFKWEGAPESKNHVIQISQTPDFKSILHQAESTESQYLFTQPLGTGRYYWRVKSQSGAASSDWTAPLFFDML